MGRLPTTRSLSSGSGTTTSCMICGWTPAHVPRRRPPEPRVLRLQPSTNTWIKTKRCLVHGDYTPKNMLHSGSRLVLLDYEIAHWGDPALDSGMLLAHLLLKVVRAPQWAEQLCRRRARLLGRPTWRLARQFSGDDLEHGTAGLLPYLILARIDSKSPVEYITALGQEAGSSGPGDPIHPASNQASRRHLFLCPESSRGKPRGATRPKEPAHESDRSSHSTSTARQPRHTDRGGRGHAWTPARSPVRSSRPARPRGPSRHWSSATGTRHGIAGRESSRLSTMWSRSSRPRS